MFLGTMHRFFAPAIHPPLVAAIIALSTTVLEFMGEEKLHLVDVGQIG